MQTLNIYNLEPKHTAEVNVNGVKLILSERRVADINSLYENINIIKNKKDNALSMSLGVIEQAITVSDGLKHFISTIPWYNIVNKFKYKRLSSPNKLIDWLTARQLNELAEIVAELDSSSLSKKKANRAE